ncbi:MAG: peptide chain release factor N(5)-glutamine methyltransferase [Alphaproteobacteria bacterium]
MSVTALTIEDALRDAARRFAAAGIETPRGEARLLLLHVLGCSRETLLSRSDRALEREAARRFEALVARRARREPLAYLTGVREFWSLSFEVSPATLIPRPDSETLIEAVLAALDDRVAPLRLLDFGTGTGCLLLALLSELPRGFGIGVDASEAALAVARRNAARHGLGGRSAFVGGSWGAALEGVFDVIVANPPYVAAGEAGAMQPEVAGFEPPHALFAGRDGLAAYRALAPDLARLLAPGGVAALELGVGQADAVARIMEAAGLTETGRRRDLAGIERCALFGRR